MCFQATYDQVERQHRYCAQIYSKANFCVEQSKIQIVSGGSCQLLKSLIKDCDRLMRQKLWYCPNDITLADKIWCVLNGKNISKQDSAEAWNRLVLCSDCLFCKRGGLQPTWTVQHSMRGTGTLSHVSHALKSKQKYAKVTVLWKRNPG